MAALDDLPLDSGRGELTGMPPSAPSSPRPKVVVGAVAVLVLVIGGGLWYTRWRQGAVDQPAAAATTAAGAAVPDREVVSTTLPPLSEMDPYVRELLATLGGHPALLRWLASDDLVGSIVTAIDRLSQGQSPARDLAVLRPTQGFSTQRRGNVSHVDPDSYTRFAPVVTAVSAADPATVAAAFTTLRPRLVEAWVAQGHPAGTFDDAVRKAVEVVASTPDVPADAALVPGAGGYAYADPAFETLPPAQKHVLRMGPEQSRRVREAARRFGQALSATPAR